MVPLGPSILAICDNALKEVLLVPVGQWDRLAKVFSATCPHHYADEAAAMAQDITTFRQDGRVVVLPNLLFEGEKSGRAPSAGCRPLARERPDKFSGHLGPARMPRMPSC
jgi:hypothetical protein